VSGGAEAPIEIAWSSPQECFPAKALAECLSAAKSIGGFAPTTPEEDKVLAEKAQEIGRRYDVSVPAKTLIAIRTMEAASAAQRSGVLAQRRANKIMAAYREGQPVVAIAGFLKLPPVAVLRQILIEQGHTAAEVKAMIRTPRTLPPDLHSQVEGIFEADLGSRTNAERIHEAATKFEEAVGARLRALGVGFATEQDSRQSGSMLTPDFLLDEPIVINGRRVHWIDAKNYPMYGGKLVAKGLEKQAQKYNGAFGPGAFVFSGGVVCGARIGAGLLLLDGSAIDSVGAPLTRLAPGGGGLEVVDSAGRGELRRLDRAQRFADELEDDAGFV